MRASNTYPSNGSKATKIAIVTLLHIGVAAALINMKVIDKSGHSKPPIEITPVTETTKIEPQPVDPDLSTKTVDPTIIVPLIDHINIEPPPDTIIGKVQPPGPPADNGRTKTGPDVPGVAVDKPAATKTFVPALANAGDCARPEYPRRAAMQGESGTVTLALLIGVDGKVADSKVSNTSGSRELDRAAIAALSMCKFKPATTNGVAEPAWGKIAYAWTLD